MADWDIRAVTTPLCCNPECRKPLTTSPSDDFCSDECQRAWHAGVVDPMAHPYDEVMATARRSERLRGPWWAAGRPAA